MEQLTATELAELQAYDSIDPFGNVEATYMMASFMAIVVNALQSIYAKKGTTPKSVDASDFIPKWGNKVPKKKREQTVEEQKRVLQTLVASVKHMKRVK